MLLFALAAAALATLASGCFRRCRASGATSCAGANIAARTTAGRRQTRMRSSLVVAQVALSIVLLLGAGLLMRTFVKLVGVDLGFDPKNLLVAGVAFPPRQHASAEDQRRFYRQALDRVGVDPWRTVGCDLANGAPPFGGMSSALEIPGTAPCRQQAPALVRVLQ